MQRYVQSFCIKKIDFLIGMKPIKNLQNPYIERVVGIFSIIANYSQESF